VYGGDGHSLIGQFEFVYVFFSIFVEVVLSRVWWPVSLSPPLAVVSWLFACLAVCPLGRVRALHWLQCGHSRPGAVGVMLSCFYFLFSRAGDVLVYSTVHWQLLFMSFLYQ
jgi:hypothetical protein